MEIVNVHDAKTHLSRILERVAGGEEVLIARSGKPIARLVPLPDKPREPGRLEGRIRIREDFDAELPKPLRRVFSGEA